MPLKKNIRQFFKGVFLVFLFFYLAYAALERTESPHSFTNQCDLCHLGLKNPSLLSREPDFLCLSCHESQKEKSHPSNLIPGRSIPETFPLFSNRLVCITCHRPHKDYNNPLNPVNNYPSLLRFRESGKLFCYTCHKGNFSKTNTNTDSHALSFKNAHSKLNSNLPAGLLDDNSKDCLGCHDGTLSVNVDNPVKDLTWTHKQNIGISHPIGSLYSESQRKKPGEFHPEKSLDKNIRLFAGKIGCETCHNHYSKIPGMLVINNFKSKLCLQCHNL